MEEKQLYGALTVYRERGAYLRRLEQIEKSKASYDEAFKNAPDNVRLLIGRSQVCSDAVKPQQAYADAELALKLEPTNMNARNMQANAMYTMSDFERSVVMNYRGSRIRKQPPYFTEGINQGLETIQDCVGKNVGHVLLDFLPIIRKQEAKRVGDDEPERVLHVSRIPHLDYKKRLTQMQARKHITLSRVLANKYLGPMAYDKFFLQALTEDPCIKSANSKGSKDLKKLIKDALETLSERQDMLRTQRPYYAIKAAEKSESKYQNKFRAQLLINECRINTRTAERLIKQIELCLWRRRIMDMMANAERMQIFLDMKTPRTLPDRDMFIDRLYKLVGEGYLSQYRISFKLSERGLHRRIAFLMGLPTGRPKSYDSVIAAAPRNVDVKVAAERVSARLEMCENSYMRCWLMYEMSRILNIQKNYALSRFYAKRCQREAQEISSVTWWLNGCFALMSGDMQQGNANEVRVQVEEAFEWSKQMQDSDQVRAFLLKCLEVASETISVDEQKANKQREKQILKVMDEDTRVETGVLFKRISRLPEGRRFSVLPRKPVQSTMTCERRKRRQRGMSIVPGEEKGLPKPPKSQVLGFQLFDI
ncbi:outer dynein arm-docking complex subunit 4-like [Pectinophora gossypiella]|uniref:outer dynein arm-docking complex subunit 4-like n=1 Tax=Pectinophora gossypiella TaxID=13191 RepID=UPI00214E3147|nr:outer dynein arm-docking complex subunit 4-like [Pectinophora gossypiella]